MVRTRGLRRSSWPVLLVALVVVGLVGCGGGSDDGSAGSSSDGSAATDGTATDGTTDGTATDDGGGGSGETFWYQGVEYDSADGSVVRSVEGLDEWPYFAGYTSKTEAEAAGAWWALVTKGGGPDVPSSVLRADLETGELTATELPASLSGGPCLCDGPYALGDQVVVVDYQHGVLQLDLATGKVAKTIKDPAVSPDSVHAVGDRLYGLAADDAGEYAIALFDLDAGSWSIVDQGALTKLARSLSGDADHLVAVLDPAQATAALVYELGADGKPTGASPVGFKTYAQQAGLESFTASAAVGSDQLWLFLDDGHVLRGPIGDAGETDDAAMSAVTKAEDVASACDGCAIGPLLAPTADAVWVPTPDGPLEVAADGTTTPAKG